MKIKNFGRGVVPCAPYIGDWFSGLRNPHPPLSPTPCLPACLSADDVTASDTWCVGILCACVIGVYWWNSVEKGRGVLTTQRPNFSQFHWAFRQIWQRYLVKTGLTETYVWRSILWEILDPPLAPSDLSAVSGACGQLSLWCVWLHVCVCVQQREGVADPEISKQVKLGVKENGDHIYLQTPSQWISMCTFWKIGQIKDSTIFSPTHISKSWMRHWHYSQPPPSTPGWIRPWKACSTCGRAMWQCVACPSVLPVVVCVQPQPPCLSLRTAAPHSFTALVLI